MRRVIALALLLAGPAVAAPPDPNSADGQIMRGHEDWITKQATPGGSLCCSTSDGRPVDPGEVRQRNGHWEVLYSRSHWPEGTGEWLSVPDSAVLPNMSPLGFPVVWVYFGKVRCLALAGAV